MNVVDNVWYEEKRGQWSVDKRKHSGVKGNSDETDILESANFTKDLSIYKKWVFSIAFIIIMDYKLLGEALQFLIFI